MSISRCAARKQVVTAAIIDGKAFAEGLRARVAAAVPAFAAQAGRAPGLAVVLVGEDPPSRVYVRAKGKATIAAGMESFEHLLDDDTTQESLLALVGTLNEDERVDGILVQLPLPGQIDEKAVIDALDPAKDVDGFHIDNVGKLAVGEEALVPCTPLGCVMMLKDRLGDLSGLEAVVLGRSNIVGKPMAQLLLRENCTVTIAHSRTRDLEDVVGRGDIVVAAVGRPAMVKGDWLKPGATVIDVGINRVEGKLVGDVDFASASEVAGAITPVPGGVGPMTIAVLLRNTLVAAHARFGLAPPEGL
jgi:methylenetetrahydrofolate dehydrogenase (NADP+)/methenyltetrahydrofolate cyclohydrolase